MENITKEVCQRLIEIALKARNNSYAPYSHYKVGAAVMTSGGEIYAGCNVENASYGLTVCAERCAIFRAVSEENSGSIVLSAIAITGGMDGAESLDIAYPCGACRQVMREFADPESFTVIVARGVEDYEIYTLEELLPYSFGPANVMT